jgi:transposase
MCKTTVDRDVNAALNILAKGALRFGADGFAGEAVKGNETRTPIL